MYITGREKSDDEVRGELSLQEAFIFGRVASEGTNEGPERAGKASRNSKILN